MAHPPRLSVSRPEVVARIALVRHGESTWIVQDRFQGQGDPPLSPRGERQVAQLAVRLARPTTDHGPPGGGPLTVFHSPLERAAATARAIAAARHPHPALVPHAGLTELSQGAWEGLTHREVEARWPVELAAWRRDPATAHPPGGESLASGARRVRDTMEEVLAHTTGRESGWTLIVAHDGILRLALLQLLGLRADRFWSFPFPLAGLTVVELTEAEPRLRAHGLVDHLTAEDERAAVAAADREGAL